jgi:uncharacterized membrane protein YkvA (DUF1232 family)
LDDAMAGNTTWLAKPGLMRTLLLQARLAVRLLREPRVPLVTRAVPVLAALYLISPLDFIPDIFPIIGQLDDLGVLLLAMELFLRLCPPGPRNFHQAAIAQGRKYSRMTAVDDVIEAEWRSQ